MIGKNENLEKLYRKKARLLWFAQLFRALKAQLYVLMQQIPTGDFMDVSDYRLLAGGRSRIISIKIFARSGSNWRPALH